MTAATQRRCIYCLKEKSPAEFNREHVLGKAWGNFKPSSALPTTTLDCVCTGCNGAFGSSFELLTARGSFDGLTRYTEGLRDDVDNIRYDRVMLTPSEPSPHAGILLRLEAVPAGELGRVGLITQICFRLEEHHRWVSIPVVALEKGNFSAELLPPFVRTRKTQCLALADGDEELARALAALRRMVPTFQQTAGLVPLPPAGGNLGVVIRTTFDNNLRRTVAKFAFNFLAAHMGAAFVLSEDFDTIRAFITSGVGDGPSAVKASDRPIMAEETSRIQFYFGHIITTDWVDHSAIRGQVSLFNHVNYVVSIARNYRGIYRADVTRGTLFDPKTGEAHELQNSRLIITGQRR